MARQPRASTTRTKGKARYGLVDDFLQRGAAPKCHHTFQFVKKSDKHQPAEGILPQEFKKPKGFCHYLEQRFEFRLVYEQSRALRPADKIIGRTPSEFGLY